MPSLSQSIFAASVSKACTPCSPPPATQSVCACFEGAGWRWARRERREETRFVQWWLFLGARCGGGREGM
jgi:hypothetical protein